MLNVGFYLHQCFAEDALFQHLAASNSYNYSFSHTGDAQCSNGAALLEKLKIKILVPDRL